jgi:hypothetical protein
MTLDEILDRFYEEYGETIGNTSIDADVLKQWINNAYRFFLTIQWRELEEQRLVNIPKTTLASTATGGTSTVTLTSAVGFWKGLTLSVSDGTFTEHHKISSTNFSTNVVTLETPIVNTFASGNNVFLSGFYAPDCRKVEYMVWKNIRSSTNPVRQIMRRTAAKNLVKEYGNINTASHPKNYEYTETNNDLIVTGTTIAGTNTTTVVTNITTYENNFFKDCVLVNKTQYRESRILNYDASAGTFTLKDPIPNQTTGDNIEIYRRQRVVSLYPLAEYPGQVEVYFSRKAPKLTNDQDIPLIPEHFHEGILYLTLALASLRDRDEFKYQGYYGLFDAVWQEAKTYNNIIEDTTVNLG